MKKVNLIAIMIVVLVLFVAFVAVVALFYSGNKEDSTTQITSGASLLSDNYNILLLGRDKTAGLSDVITIASIDMKNNNVNIMQIPRDTYFNYGNDEHNKINGAPCVIGVSSFSDRLAQTLGIDIDYYLSLDLDVLEEIIDMISGIDIEVPLDMDYDDPAQNLSIHLKAGKNHLNGKEAIGFLRYRSGYVTGDIGRLDAQKLFMDAFFTRFSEQKNFVVFYNVFKLVSAKTETNIREQDIISMGLKMNSKKDMKVYYMTAPGEAVRSDKSGAWYYILSSPSMSELLKNGFGAYEKDFDKNNKFVDKQVKSFYDIYKKRCEYKIYSAEEVKSNKININ